VKLTIVGCAGTFPGPKSACSSYLVEHDGYKLLLDAGNGSTGALQRTVGLLDLDAVMISHMHGDHFLDLVTYTYARRYHPEGNPACLPVHGPSDVADHVAAAFGRPVKELLDAVYEFHPASGPSTLDLGPFSIERERVNHPVETYAMRITAGGKTLVYSADSGVSEELVKLARDADLFLCEASYLEGEDNPPDIHLTGKEAGEHASRAGARKLVLTHLVPWGDEDRTLEEATAAYDGEIAVACSDRVFDI